MHINKHVFITSPNYSEHIITFSFIKRKEIWEQTVACMFTSFWNNLLCLPAGISVSISTFSLVAIAIERYSAICNPLKSRVWQTRSHAYRVIAATWVLAFIIMIPYPVISHLESFERPDNTTAHQCRHKWPVAMAEQTWWVFGCLMMCPFNNLDSLITQSSEWQFSARWEKKICFSLLL